MKQIIKSFVGMDVHKATISISVAEDGRSGPVRFIGVIPNTPEAVGKMAKQLARHGELDFCYEASGCGYGIHRQLTTLGHKCTVAAPSMIPRKPGERIKTDRRDSEKHSTNALRFGAVEIFGSISTSKTDTLVARDLDLSESLGIRSSKICVPGLRKLVDLYQFSPENGSGSNSMTEEILWEGEGVRCGFSRSPSYLILSESAFQQRLHHSGHLPRCGPPLAQ
ncbi:MAG: putative transposase [Edaphobacter sp.]|nr:putative transposase [Edaphobacter sp.]